MKALGVRYEKALAKAIPSAKHGQWWEFRDENGPGWCQTDLLVEGPNLVLVLEAKYSWVIDGHSQLELLYRPVVELALGKPMIGVVVCKVLRRDMPGRVKVVSTIADAINCAKAGRSVCLHWIGVGGLGALPSPSHESPHMTDCVQRSRA